MGSHYTYSAMPLGDWLRDAAEMGRNHYDRVVHFAFGLLMLRPLRELSLGPAERTGRTALVWLSVAQVLACSALYELVEGIVASLADPAAGTAYLGTQGDVWDSQKDMACAGTGALIAALLECPLLRRRSSSSERTTSPVSGRCRAGYKRTDSPARRRGCPGRRWASRASSAAWRMCCTRTR